MAKRKSLILVIIMILLALNLSSCHYHGYLPLPKPDQMILHYKTGEEKQFSPNDEQFEALFECVSTDLWIIGSSPIYCACYHEGEEYRWQQEDYLRLVYNQEATLIEPYQEIPEGLTVTSIIFTPNANWEEYDYNPNERYYLETPDEMFKSYFDTSDKNAPYYPPLAELFDQLK